MSIIDLGTELAKIPINNSRDVIAARYESRQHAVNLSFSPRNIMRLTTAVSELARNIIQHAQSSGVITIYSSEDEHKKGIVVQATDTGIGIANCDEVLKKSHLVMGGGLYGTMKFASEFSLDSSSGRGTNVIFRKWSD